MPGSGEASVERVLQEAFPFAGREGVSLDAESAALVVARDEHVVASREAPQGMEIELALFCLGRQERRRLSTLRGDLEETKGDASEDDGPVIPPVRADDVVGITESDRLSAADRNLLELPVGEEAESIAHPVRRRARKPLGSLR